MYNLKNEFLLTFFPSKYIDMKRKEHLRKLVMLHKPELEAIRKSIQKSKERIENEFKSIAQ
jgi:predicted  nucleic acid-binding Zn-ribbon protein